MTEEEAENADQYSSSHYGMVIDPSLAKYFVDFEDVIDSLRLVLEGKDIDYQHQPPKLVQFGEPLLNQHGVGKVTAKLKMLHKGVPMSNFEKHMPYVLTKLQTLSIAKELFVHMNDYGIKSTDDMNKIIELVMVSLISMYNRPVGEGERNFIKGYTRESHVINQQKKKGFSLT